LAKRAGGLEANQIALNGYTFDPPVLLEVRPAFFLRLTPSVVVRIVGIFPTDKMQSLSPRIATFVREKVAVHSVCFRTRIIDDAWESKLRKLASSGRRLLSTLSYSRRQASGLSFEAILPTRRQVLQIRQFHVVVDLSKLQTWSNIPMKQASSMLTPTHRE
jgi:hypothetical protein